VALILGTPVSRSSLLVASDLSSLLFRIPPLIAIIAVVSMVVTAAYILRIVGRVFFGELPKEFSQEERDLILGGTATSVLNLKEIKVAVHA